MISTIKKEIAISKELHSKIEWGRTYGKPKFLRFEANSKGGKRWSKN